MKFLLIILATGFVAAVVATNTSDAAVLKSHSMKDAVRDRILKGATRSKEMTKKPVKPTCKPAEAYAPPEGCSDTCYSDMGDLFSIINRNLENGDLFNGTVCQGTYTLPASINVEGIIANADVTLRCCGPKNSCVINGGGPDNTRDNPVFRFRSTLKQFILEGITFQNFKSNSEVLLVTERTSVVTIKNVEVKSTSGGAVLYFGSSSSVVTTEGCSFKDNHGLYDGSSIFAAYSRIALHNNTFFGNTAESNGGAVHALVSSVIATCNTFEQNHAVFAGGAVYGYGSDLEFSYNVFTKNKADQQGGAVYVAFNPMISSGNSFTSNIAKQAGGAIYGMLLVIESTDDNFDSNSVSDATGDVGQNIYLLFSVLEYCRSPISETTQLESITFDRCI